VAEVLRKTFNVFTDYHSFLVEDVSTDRSGVAELITDEMIERMFVQGDDYVIVGTARPMESPVEVRVFDAAPPPTDGQWDRTNRGHRGRSSSARATR